MKKGNEYGFPRCCVKWFWKRIRRKVVFELTFLQEKYHCNGFIPCPNCAEKLDRENMRLDQLIITEIRIKKKPFPISYPRNIKPKDIIIDFNLE